MKVVFTGPIVFGNRMLRAKLFYGDDDLVLTWEMIYGNLNLSKMTFAQVEELTGLTIEDVNRYAHAIQTMIDKQEGRI